MAKREPLSVRCAYERVVGMDRAHGIVADLWRDRVWSRGLFREEQMNADPVAKALYDVMEKIDAAKRADDKVWRDFRYPNDEAEVSDGE